MMQIHVFNSKTRRSPALLDAITWPQFIERPSYGLIHYLIGRLRSAQLKDINRRADNENWQQK